MAKTSKRLAIKMLHRDLIKQDMETAHILFKLLRHGQVTLDLSDKAHEAEVILDKIGCLITYSSPYYIATAFDYGK